MVARLSELVPNDKIPRGPAGIGLRLKNARIAANYSVRSLQVAIRAGSYGTIKDWEAGTRLPPMWLFIEACTVLNVSLDEIIDFDPKGEYARRHEKLASNLLTRKALP